MLILIKFQNVLTSKTWLDVISFQIKSCKFQHVLILKSALKLAPLISVSFGTPVS